MNFNLRTSTDPNQDLIIPIPKGELDIDQIFNLTGIKKTDFEGGFSEFQTLYGKNRQHVYLLGLGELKDSPRVFEAFRKFSFKTAKYWSQNIQLKCQDLDKNKIIQAVLGIVMASYNLGAYKSEKKDETFPNKRSSMFLISENNLTEEIEEGRKTAETINRIKTLVDAPSNYKTPKYLADWARDSASRFDYECKVFDRDTLEKEGFEALLSVGRGSIHAPCLIQTSYIPKKGGKIDIGLVGKGITFDTGGLSIKPSQNLHYMKSDMGGASVVLGAVELAAKLKLNLNIIGIVAAAENAVDANSIRPGDVIGSYSGKTIEVIDTDAEGRLVLADALSYIIKHHKPERLVDLATLTGSIVRTLGYSAAGMFTKNKEMTEVLGKIGDSIHERVWPLPMYDDFDEELHSDIADIRNFSNKPTAGAISAAKFLEAFTESHEKWVHLDIAGMAFGDSDYAKMKSATGFGVRLMIEYMKSLEK